MPHRRAARAGVVAAAGAMRDIPAAMARNHAQCVACKIAHVANKTVTCDKMAKR